ncbi:MAG: hypothetical protein HZA08_01060 [Nitrospirae bacterium]|nr:hypothetical protein [Nitrospirota bacterium]
MPDRKVFKVHTDNFQRLAACILYGMYGITNDAFTYSLPRELSLINTGDIVFISERETSNNTLFGPLYVVENRRGVIARSKRGAWINIDINRSSQSELAYWVELEGRHWCLLFDKTLLDKISVVWPQNWIELNVELPSWGLIIEPNASRLIDFALNNELDSKKFLREHGIFR